MSFQRWRGRKGTWGCRTGWLGVEVTEGRRLMMQCWSLESGRPSSNPQAITS